MRNILNIIINLFAVVFLAYVIYEFVAGENEGWEWEQLIWVSIGVAIVTLVNYFGNKINRKRKGL